MVFDTVGGATFEQGLDCIAVNGRAASIVYTKTDVIFDKLFGKNGTLHLEFMGVPTWHGVNPGKQGEQLTLLTKVVEAGKIKPHVCEVISLEDIPAAHEAQASGRTVGKRVVKIK